MRLADENNRKSKPRTAGDSGAGPRPPADPQMGTALRSVYQKAVEEPVPAEMLDLLAKLG